MMKENKYKPYKTALVGLDLTEMDDHLVQYAAMISKVFPMERIFFVHVAKDLQLPDDLLKEYPGLLDPLDDSIETDIQKNVDQHFEGSAVETVCIVKEGNPIEKMLKLSKVKDVDLILMGRKKSLQGSGIVSSRIARKCPCSLLLVTQDCALKIDKLLVPIDFSDHSVLAMHLASAMQEGSKASLETVHVYGVPIGYYKTGKSYEEFAEIMRNHAAKDFSRFLEKHHFPISTSCTYILTDDGKYPELTYDYAVEHGTNIIVIGSRGRTNISALLMGSTAEKLVFLSKDIPVLIAKEKGENMGFLDTLMKI